MKFPQKSKHVAVYSATCWIVFDCSVCYFSWWVEQSVMTH